MSKIRLGDIAPNFTAVTTEGEIDFHEWLGDGWGVLFSHPAGGVESRVLNFVSRATR